MKDKAERAYGFFIAVSVHACILIMLSVTVVNLWPDYYQMEEPQVQQVDIGQQSLIPHEASLSGVVDPADLPVLESGAEVENPEDDEILEPTDEILEQMLIDPEKPLPADTTKNPEWGTPTDPVRPSEQDEGNLSQLKDNRGAEAEGAKEIFGNKISGKVVFLLDLSGSMEDGYMGTDRLVVLKAELLNTIKTLTSDDEFDIVIYHGSLPSWGYYTKSLWGQLIEANEANKQAAIDWVKALSSGSSTPTYEALKYICQFYPTDLEHFIFITDGQPDSGTEEMIIKEFPKYWKRFSKCNFVCISIGTVGLTFVKRLADSVGGKYNVS